MSIHQLIRDGRKRLGMTESQFADAVGVTRGAVQQWEKEGGTAPKRSHQPAVAKLLGVSVAELMGGRVEASLPAITATAATTTPQSIHSVLRQLSTLLDGCDDFHRETIRNALARLVDQPARYADVADLIDVALAASSKKNAIRAAGN